MLKEIIKKIININNPPYLIKSNSLISAGKMSYHNGNFIIQGGQKIYIGNFCAFGENIRIITENHDYNYPAIQYIFHRHFFMKNHPGNYNFPPNKEKTKGPVIIGNDVWIGHNVTILSGIEIGDGACIGTGSLITKNITPYSIVGGVPARLIKMRFREEIIEYLQEIKWWNWDENKIKRNKDFFYSNLNLLTLDEIKLIIK